MNDVPAQVVHRNHLRRQILFLALRPDYLPVAAVVDELEVLVLIQRADGGFPFEIGAYQSFISVMRDHSEVGILQLRQSFQTSVAASDVVAKAREINVARTGC